MLDLSIVILNFNTKKITINCLESIFNNQWKISFDVWVVDNASTDGSVKAIKAKFPKVKIIQNKKNLGYAAGNNLGIKQGYNKAKKVLVLNSDTILLPRSLDILVSVSEKEDYDITSCKLLNKDKSFQPNAGNLPRPLPVFFWLSGLDDILGKLVRIPSYHERNNKYYQGQKRVEWVSGTVILINSNLFKKIGFFDEKIFMYAEDVDYCWRANNQGLKVGWTDKARIIHLGGASFKDPKYNQWLGEFRGLLYLYQKYYGLLAKVILSLFIRIFSLVRAFAFIIVGKPEYAKNYAKIFISL